VNRPAGGTSGLGTSGTTGDDALAAAERVEGLVDGVEEVVDVLLHDTGLLVVDGSDVVLDDIGVGAAEEVEATITHGITIDNIVAVNIVSTWGDGVGASDVGRGVGNDGKAGRGGTTEPVGSESLVTEDRAETVGRKLGGGAVGKELEDESDFGERGEDAGDVELELLVFLLILVESVELELLEDLVVGDGVVASSGVAVTVFTDVV